MVYCDETVVPKDIENPGVVEFKLFFRVEGILVNRPWADLSQSPVSIGPLRL